MSSVRSSVCCVPAPTRRVAAALQPQVGLERLDDLVARARADGLAVTVSGGDLATTLPVAVSTAAYRVLQEALSNVRRHAAPGARVEVRVSVDGDGACARRGRRTTAARCRPPVGEQPGGGSWCTASRRVSASSGCVSASSPPVGGSRRGRRPAEVSG